MASYHKYVFDTNKRTFVGEFEKMYQNESTEGFDAWHQEDARQLQRQIDLAILQHYNFSKILDLGCGKGSFTHLLKKRNNSVVAVDISPTAIKVAQERYPDLQYAVLDLQDLSLLENFLQAQQLFELTFSSEVLSYLPNYQQTIQVLAKYSQHLLISLFIPENPIGFVKSEQDLVSSIAEHFDIIEHISLRKSRFTIVFAKSKLF